MARIVFLAVAAQAVAAAALPSFAPAPSPSPVVLGAAPQPWLPLNGGAFSGAPAPLSPDPLVRYVWPLPGGVDDSLLQIFTVPAVACGPHGLTAPGAFAGTASCGGATDAVNITVSGNGTLIFSLGVELAAWVEFESPDLQPADAGSLVLGIGEYTEVDYVGGFKQDTPKVYGAGCGAATCTYRLETSPVGPELYEGVRYGFLTLRSAPSAPFTITALRAVAQAKPMNYVGSFSSAGDPLLERVWYTAAYTVRVCAQSDYMGSILMNRGDRFSWFVALQARALASRSPAQCVGTCARSLSGAP